MIAHLERRLDLEGLIPSSSSSIRLEVRTQARNDIEGGGRGSARADGWEEEHGARGSDREETLAEFNKTLNKPIVQHVLHSPSVNYAHNLSGHSYE